MIDLLRRALVPSPPIEAGDGGYIAAGYDVALDDLRDAGAGGRRTIAALEAEFRQQTGVTALKIRHNNVLGYHVEVPARAADALMKPDSGFTHRQTLAGVLVPVLLGSALRNKGIQPLLDAVVAYLPSPVDVGAVMSVDGAESRLPSPDAPVSALAFKAMTPPGGATLTFVRVYSGVLRRGMVLATSRDGGKERVGRLVVLHAASVQDVDEVGPSMKYATAKVNKTSRGGGGGGGFGGDSGGGQQDPWATGGSAPSGGASQGGQGGGWNQPAGGQPQGSPSQGGQPQGGQQGGQGGWGNAPAYDEPPF